MSERVSIVAPMLNEARHVDGFVDDVAAQDYEGPLELIVADGGSSDGSVERLRDAAARHGLDLAVLDNPARFVSQGLNACIRRASGRLIVRLDCHSRYPRDYVRRCADASRETGAWNVGGVVRAAGTTPGERAVASAMDSAFGGIGWTRAESAGGRAEVDTVTYGAFRREAFERAGLYDETLIRNQDDELNLRLRLAGGTIVLDPAIEVFYTPRASWRRVFRQYYEYGLWKIPVMLRHRRVLSARSLAPAAFVLGLLGGALLGFVWRPAWALTAAVVAVYAIAALAFAAASVRRRGEPAALVPRVVAVYTAFHIGYGVGMLHGALRALLRPAAPAGGPPQLERLPEPGHEGDEADPERP